jgi:hypothetical protein
MTTEKTTRFTNTKEFYDLRNDFERIFKGERMDRENKEMYEKGAFYQNGQTNNLFKAFLSGYQLGRINYMN